MIIPNSVLLLKSQTSKDSIDKYEELLISIGFAVKEAKTLVFEFKNLDSLVKILQNEDQYEGLIFSSPRCVAAVHYVSKNNSDLLQQWRTKHNFAVGEATYKDALDKLEIDCRGRETGNAENLSQFILQSKHLFSKPFLFPHGNLKTDTLSRELGKGNLILEEVLVYDTIPNPDIEHELAGITESFHSVPEYVVFFSPSGLHSSLKYLRRAESFPKAKLIAIGPVTELAMKEENLDVFGVMKNPTPKHLIDLLVAR